jgi:ketosteroid isomerase-like protein
MDWIMRNLIIKSLLFSLAVTSIGCSAKKEEVAAAPVIDKEQIKKEIQAKENEYAATYNSGEVKDISYYADDATVFAQNRGPFVGKEAIISYLKDGFDHSTKGNSITCTTKEVFVSNDANQVVEVGYFTLVDSVKTLINSGNYMILFEKRNGGYVSVREMSTSDLSVE